MAFTPEELTDLARAYWRGEVPGCPRCTARVQARPLQISTHQAPDWVHFTCPTCDEAGMFETEPAKDPWTDEQVQAIARDAARHGEARCPADDAVIRVRKPGGTIPWRDFSCPLCGRNWAGESRRGHGES